MAQDNAVSTGKELPITLAFHVTKGGVTKTTSASHVGTGIANLGFDVVIVDLSGSQNDLAKQFGMNDETSGELELPLSAIFEDSWDKWTRAIDSEDILDRMLFKTEEGPWIIPEDAGLGAQDNNLAGVDVEDRYTFLRDRLVNDVLADKADFVLFDLPGGEDNNVALNGLGATDHVIAPVTPGKFEQEQLDKVPEQLNSLKEGKNNIDAELRMVLPSKIKSNTNLSADFLDYVNSKEVFKNLVAPRAVPFTQEIPNQQADGRTLFALDDEDLYDTGVRAKQAYEQATRDLLERIGVEVDDD